MRSMAYHQGYIDSRFLHLTAFITPWTLYKFVCVSFGLGHAPPAIQRFINRMLGDYEGEICEPYLDDVLTHSETFDQHLLILRKF